MGDFAAISDERRVAFYLPTLTPAALPCRRSPWSSPTISFSSFHALITGVIIFWGSSQASKPKVASPRLWSMLQVSQNLKTCSPYPMFQDLHNPSKLSDFSKSSCWWHQLELEGLGSVFGTRASQDRIGGTNTFSLSMRRTSILHSLRDIWV